MQSNKVKFSRWWLCTVWYGAAATLIAGNNWWRLMRDSTRIHTCIECMGIGMHVKGREPPGCATLFLLYMQTHWEVNWKAAITCHSKPPHSETAEGPDSVFGLCGIHLLFLPLLMCNVVIATQPMRLLLLKPLQSLLVAANRDHSQSPGVSTLSAVLLEDGWTNTEIESLHIWLDPRKVAYFDVVRPVHS